MLNDTQDQLTNSPSSIWQRAIRYLFEPHQDITEIGERRQARLVSIIIFVFGFLNLVGAISIFFANGLTRNGFVLIGLAIVSFTSYTLTRTRYYRVGSYMVTWALVFTAFGIEDVSRLSISLFTNLILAFILASITFPVRYMTFFIVVNNLAIALIPIVYPDFTEVGATLGVFVPFSILTLVAMQHRKNTERDRLTESKQMNHDLTTLSNELEQRVEERTAKLEERARQLQVVSEVANAAASIQDPDQLLEESTSLISNSFGFYHVGIFLLSQSGENAILQAANSEGGQRMLARNHFLPVDLNSIVGYAAKTQAPRIARDTGADAVHFTNPDLPETRSEMAVPLKIGARLIGVLDVQSSQKNAFSEDDVAILSTLGNQLAVAIENARLLSETRRALETAEHTYQRYFSQAWSQFSQKLDVDGYTYQNGSIVPIDVKEEENQEIDTNDSKIKIPLMVRGQDIGILEIQPKNKTRNWTTDEVTLLEAAAERAALALESARLLEDAQRRASRERTISEMANKIGSVTNIDSILKSTVEELGKHISGTEVSFELNTDLQGMQ